MFPTRYPITVKSLCIAVPILLCTVACGYGQASQSAQTPTLQELKDKLQRIEKDMADVQDEIKALESTNAAAKPASELPAGNAEDHAAEDTTSPVKAGLGTLQLYGFSQLDAGYNFGQIDPDWYDTMRPTKLAAYKNEFAPNGTVFFSVRQTRFGVKTSTPTKYGDLKTIFEPDVLPDSVEYWGPSGMVFFRNLQFRWMPIHRDNLQLWLAAEKPGASADGGAYSGRIELQDVAPKFDFPDISWRVRTSHNWGYLQVAGIFRKITWVDLNPTPTFNIGDTVLGWGINTSTNLKVTKKDTLKLQVIYGAGIENYMNDAPNDVGVKTNPSEPSRPLKGVALPELGVVAFLDHDWNSKFSSTIGYSLANIWNSNGQLPSDFHQGDYALTNLLYYPIKNVMVGGEMQYGRRVNFSDGWNVN